MMKSRPSAIKLRLSRLIRCLLALGCLKLVIMGVALFDLPMPAWRDSVEQPTATADPVTQTLAQETAPQAPEAEMAPQANVINEELPQGSAAAELASAAKPRTANPWNSAIMPAPMVGASESRASASGAFSPSLPTPPALGVPLAKAGISLPGQESAPVAENDESIWDMLNLKSLPIPGLGSARAAHAAALDMPVPSIPGNISPFTPAEQLPGGSASMYPASGAAAQSEDGAPLPPRQYTGSLNSQSAGINPTAGFNAPAPTIQPRPSSMEPSVKSQDLARQEQDILMLRQQMDQRLKDLQNAEDKMKGILNEAKGIEDQKVKSLVQMYSNMKPKMAAQAMEKMDERIAVRILSGMAPKQSGEILTYTNPAKTAKFTEMITRLRMMD